MYSIFQAYGLSKEFDSLFKEVDLSNYTVAQVFNNFTKVYLSLNYTYSQNQIIVDFDQLKAYKNNNTPLSTFLQNLSPGYFNPLPSLPFIKISYSRYKDAEMAGYSINSPVAQSLLNNTDIILNNSNVYMQSAYNKCIFTVDGFIMPSTLVDDYIVIKDGLFTSMMNNYTKVGIISFEDSGNIVTQSLDSSNISLSKTRSPSDLLYINSYAIDGYITFLVLNGYLIAPTTEGFYYIGNGNYSLSLNKLGYPFKILDSRYKQYYNYDLISTFLPQSLLNQLNDTKNILNQNNDNQNSLNQNNSPLIGNPFSRCYNDSYNPGYTNNEDSLNANSVNLNILNNPLFINAYLTLPNTFLLFIPANNVVVKNKNIFNSDLVNSLVLDYEPKDIMYGSQGRIVDYTYMKKDGKYIVTSPNMYINNYVDIKNQPNLPTYLRDNRIPNEALVKSQLAFKQYGFY